jgi:hypothetical protein
LLAQKKQALAGTALQRLLFKEHHPSKALPQLHANFMFLTIAFTTQLTHCANFVATYSSSA